jgi:hypothetical protein
MVRRPAEGVKAFFRDAVSLDGAGFPPDNPADDDPD